MTYSPLKWSYFGLTFVTEFPSCIVRTWNKCQRLWVNFFLELCRGLKSSCQSDKSCKQCRFLLTLSIVNSVFVRKCSRIRDCLWNDGSKTYYKVFVTDALCIRLLATQKRLFGDVEAIELALTDFKARLPSPMPLGARKKRSEIAQIKVSRRGFVIYSVTLMKASS